MKANKQIMKISFFIAASALIVGCATAQKSSFNQIDINGNMRFKGRTITGINNDSTFASHDSMSIPTSWAVYNYFKNQEITGISTNHPYVVSSQSAMLALSANVGDVAVRTDESKSYILQNLPADSLSNWVYMPSPIPPTTDLLSEGSTNKYYTDARVLAYVTGKNISLFSNDLNFTQRSELIDSSLNSYKNSSQIDSFSFKINKGTGNPGTVVKVINTGSSGGGGNLISRSELLDSINALKSKMPPNLDDVLSKNLGTSYNNYLMTLRNGSNPYTDYISLSPVLGLQGRNSTDTSHFQINSVDGFKWDKVNSSKDVTVKWGKGWSGSISYPIEFPSLLTNHPGGGYGLSTYIPLAVNDIYANNNGVIYISQFPINQKSSDPTNADIATGMSAIYKNTTSGSVYLWVNNSGTMLKVQLN